MTFTKRLSVLIGLRYEEDLRTLMFMGVYVSLIVFQFNNEITSWLGRITMFLITTFSAFQGAVSVHNAVHCPAFKNMSVNAVFLMMLSCWFGHCASAYVPGHNLSHHRHLQVRKDREHESVCAISFVLFEFPVCEFRRTRAPRSNVYTA